ncbi:MAG: hypothetical protein U0R52_03480 [Solirubrobacterales bacterium]
MLGLRRAAALAATLAATLALAPIASAGDPGRWLLSGASSVPVNYWQGLASDPAGENVFFTGFREGLWRTTPRLLQTAGVAGAIPPEVFAAEGYNHIGDPSWDPGEGGRVLLPMECYSFSAGNTCGTGSFGVADPATLAFRYYVKLDPAEIPKAMWAETSPNGRLVWTSSGGDLLAYRSSQITPANRAPGGPLLRSVRRLSGAVPPSGITGAVFRRHRLLLAGSDGAADQVFSVDTRTGDRRLEIEMDICGESEGLDTVSALGGTLQWLIAPFDPGCQLSFGPTSALLHFTPSPGRERFDVEVTSVQAGALPGTVEVGVRATDQGRPVRWARVSFAGADARTGRDGSASVAVFLQLPGRFRAVVTRGHSYGASALVPVGLG